MNLTDKVLLLSNPDFQQKNFSLIINILLENNYLLEFIFSSIRKKLSVKFRLLNNHKSMINLLPKTIKTIISSSLTLNILQIKILTIFQKRIEF